MKTIIELCMYAAFAALAYSVGFNSAKKKSQSSVDIDVSKKGFDYLVSVSDGKTITIKNSSGKNIIIIPDLETFQKEDK